MPYKNWSEDAQVAADALMPRKRSMLDVLQQMSGIKFPLVTQRQSAIDMWTNMDREYPVDCNTRFKDCVTYINFEDGDFARLEAQMLQALDLKEFSKHRDMPKQLPEQPSGGRMLKVQSETGHTEGVLLTASSEDDANTAYRNAVRALKMAVGHAANTVGRASFEARFGLEWEEPKKG